MLFPTFPDQSILFQTFKFSSIIHVTHPTLNNLPAAVPKAELVPWKWWTEVFDNIA